VLAGRPAVLDDSLPTPAGPPPREAQAVSTLQGALLERLAAARGRA
jgi:hypothetical protein